MHNSRQKGGSGNIFFYLYQMEWQFTLDQIGTVANEFWAKFSSERVFAFTGDLGAGKTTFIKALCASKGVKDLVTSPTFSIINEYKFAGGRIYHLDLYRLKDEAEAVQAGVEDCLYSGEICLVEWPEVAAGILPGDAQFIEIETIDPQTRKIRAAGA